MQNINKKAIAFYIWMFINFCYFLYPETPGYGLAIANILFAIAAILVSEER